MPACCRWHRGPSTTVCIPEKSLASATGCRGSGPWKPTVAWLKDNGACRCWAKSSKMGIPHALSERRFSGFERKGSPPRGRENATPPNAGVVERAAPGAPVFSAWPKNRNKSDDFH